MPRRRFDQFKGGTMSEQENIDLVAKTYQLFKSGKIDELLNLYADDFSWELPLVEGTPFGGKVRGREAVTQFFVDLDKAEENLTFETEEFIPHGDKVVVLGNFSWRAKATNKTYQSRFAHLVTVRDGKIVGFYEYMDTAARNRAHMAAKAA